MPPFGDEDEVIDSDEGQELDTEETAEEEELESDEEELDEGSEEEETDSEDEEEEQSEEDQDPDELEEEEEEEEPEEEGRGFKFKDKKTGNFDWNRINQRLGGSDLQKTFLESQKTITRVSQEKKELESRISEFEESFPQIQQQAHLFQQFDQMVQNDPEVQRAVVAALQRQNGGAPGAAPGVLPENVNPNDPLVPLLMETRQTLAAIQNQQRMEQSTRQQNQVRDMERQGLTQARDKFQELTGRLPTKDELGRVLQEMRTNRNANGALFVPGLFLEEIRKSERRKLDKSREQKRNLPKTAKKTVRGKTSTSKKSLSLREAVDKATDELGIEF